MQPLPTKLRRPRGQLLPFVGIGLIALMTLANAAANMLPVHRTSAAELRREEQRTLVEQRRVRIAALRASGERCVPATAHELARLLVLDGQWGEARGFAEGYERTCGEDPVVHHWGNAPRPRSAR